MIKRLLLLSLTLGASACSTLVPAPAPLDRPRAEPIESWARVLQAFVDEQGRINFRALARDRADLDRYVTWIYANGPGNQPSLYDSPPKVLAYHLNAYNALAMFNVIESGIPQTNTGLGKVRFFFLRKLQVGGVAMSLYDYENQVIRKLGDPRVHVALNCMSRGCPRLPRVPFKAEILDQQLDAAARQFFAEPRNARADETEKIVYLSEILDFYPKDFLAQAPSLTAYANRYRTTKLPETYPVKFTPYDWTINQQP